MASSSQCFYPNGNPSTGDIPCGSGDGVACCPQGWTCEPNGLCHLASPFYYGRYTCTDKTWKSKGCPNICTHGNTAAGAEAVIECSSGQYCCDANRPDALPNGSIDETKDCCHTSTSRFPLAQLPLAPGGAEDSGGSGGSNGAAASSSSTSSTSTSSTPAASSTPQFSSALVSTSSSSSTSSTSSSNAGPSSSGNASPTSQTSIPASSTGSTPQATSIITSVITQNAGGSSTLITSTGSAIPAALATSTPPPSSKSNNHASTIAPAVAVPVAVLLLAALAFFLFRRRRRQNETRASSPPPMADYPHPMYGNDPKDLNDSPYTGKSELEGSPNIMQPGTPGKGEVNGYHTPSDVGAAGARESSKSELAASNSTMRSPKSRLSELQGSPSIATSADEEVQQPAELHGGETQQGTNYKPYRPPGLGLTE